MYQSQYKNGISFLIYFLKINIFSCRFGFLKYGMSSEIILLSYDLIIYFEIDSFSLLAAVLLANTFTGYPPGTQF